jgi:hypothetical protein
VNRFRIFLTNSSLAAAQTDGETNLADMPIDHLDGILNRCRTKLPLGVVDAVNGNIKSPAPPQKRISKI